MQATVRAGAGGFWPILGRELLVASRSPFCQGAKLMGAGTACLAFFLQWLHRDTSTADWNHSGPELLRGITWLGSMLAIIGGPVAISDSISSERREATLGLLFLTPMRDSSLAAAKLLSHGCQLALGIAAMVPALVLCALLGGVSPWDFLSTLALWSGSLSLSAGIGLWASTREERGDAALWKTYQWIYLILGTGWIGLGLLVKTFLREADAAETRRESGRLALPLFSVVAFGLIALLEFRSSGPGYQEIARSMIRSLLSPSPLSSLVFSAQSKAGVIAPLSLQVGLIGFFAGFIACRQAVRNLGELRRLPPGPSIPAAVSSSNGAKSSSQVSPADCAVETVHPLKHLTALAPSVRNAAWLCSALAYCQGLAPLISARWGMQDPWIQLLSMAHQLGISGLQIIVAWQASSPALELKSSGIWEQVRVTPMTNTALLRALSHPSLHVLRILLTASVVCSLALFGLQWESWKSTPSQLHELALGSILLSVLALPVRYWCLASVGVWMGLRTNMLVRSICYTYLVGLLLPELLHHIIVQAAISNSLLTPLMGNMIWGWATQILFPASIGVFFWKNSLALLASRPDS